MLSLEPLPQIAFSDDTCDKRSAICMIAYSPMSAHPYRAVRAAFYLLESLFPFAHHAAILLYDNKRIYHIDMNPSIRKNMISLDKLRAFVGVAAFSATWVLNDNQVTMFLKSIEEDREKMLRVGSLLGSRRSAYAHNCVSWPVEKLEQLGISVPARCESLGFVPYFYCPSRLSQAFFRMAVSWGVVLALIVGKPFLVGVGRTEAQRQGLSFLVVTPILLPLLIMLPGALTAIFRPGSSIHHDRLRSIDNFLRSAEDAINRKSGI